MQSYMLEKKKKKKKKKKKRCGSLRTPESIFRPIKYLNKWESFLKKLWCCVGGGVVRKMLVLSTPLIKPNYR